MVELRLVETRHIANDEEELFHVGRRYSLAEDLALDQARPVCADTDLLIGGYHIGSERAELVAADAELHPQRQFVWNADAAGLALQAVLRPAGAQTGLSAGSKLLACNRLVLTGARLDGPELSLQGADARLGMTAEFELEWHTDVCAAQLAAVELVQSQRMVRFEDGSERVLLDTHQQPDGVRYVHPDDDGQPLRPVAAQPCGQSGQHLYRAALSQAIPQQLDGRAVAEVTVLEKYSSYLLQNEAPQDPDNHIWVPLHSPLMWGWSIRVGRRTDGEWGILRRKLFMPTGEDEGMSLPLWQSNTALLAAG